MAVIDTLNRDWDGREHKFDLIHLGLVWSPGRALCGTVCTFSIANSTKLTYC